MATELQVVANTTNAQRSTGPTSDDGKLTASQNALKHGLRSEKLVLEDEDPVVFEGLRADLFASLEPEGAVENALVERIALCLWRQRRLVAFETAELQLARRPTELARRLAYLPDVHSEGSDLELLEPFNEDQRRWCREVLAEIEALDSVDAETVKVQAPLTYAQLQGDAEEDEETIDELLDRCEGGMSRYLADLARWCHTQLRQAEQRPTVLALAEQLRARHLVLPLKQLEVIARYQTTLDNQLYKALRALREAQDWRIQRTRSEADGAE